jgi:hypothetical protein
MKRVTDRLAELQVSFPLPRKARFPPVVLAETGGSAIDAFREWRRRVRLAFGGRASDGNQHTALAGELEALGRREWGGLCEN